MVALSESDLIWASATGLAGFFFLGCCVGFCCWRDAQRRSRWDREKDVDGSTELEVMEGGLPVSRLARAAAAKAAAAVPPMFAPLLARGYVAPSRRLDAKKWRQRGNNVQSKFAKVTAVFEDFSTDDQLFRAYGALSVQDDGSEPRSARSLRSTPSMDNSGSMPADDKAARKDNNDHGVRKDAGLGKKAPRRGEKSLKKSAAGVIQGNDPSRGRTLSAEAQAALEGRQPGKSSGTMRGKGTDKSLVRVQPPLPLDIAALRPTMLGKDGEIWPVTDPPPVPLSPVTRPPPPLPPPATPPPDDRTGRIKPPIEKHVLPAPIEEVLPPKTPLSMPPAPLANRLPNGGDLLGQIEFLADAPREKLPVVPRSPAPLRKKTTPVPSEDEDSTSSGLEEPPPRHRTPRQPRTPEAGRRDLKFAALDAELAEEVEAEVNRAVSLAFDPKALQRSSSGLPCPFGESYESAKKAKKRSPSPKGKDRKQKKKKGDG